MDLIGKGRARADIMPIIQLLAIASIVIGCLVFFGFLIKANSDGFSISGATDYTTSGQFGDYIGGIAGTLFALAGTLLLFLNLREQVKENKRSAFEASFFEMIRLHRSNVSELVCPDGEGGEFHNRKVIREVYKEFIDCYREVRRFYGSSRPEDYIVKRQIKKLEEIKQAAGCRMDLAEMAAINIAFLIVYYGLSSEGETIVKDYLVSRYKDCNYHRLIFFLRLKPKRSNPRFHSWKEIQSLPRERFHEIVSELYKHRRRLDDLKSASAEVMAVVPLTPYLKYYGGHQYRLGHYFRHLYQSFKYLDSHPDIDEGQKYQYGKLLRAQLSTYEQLVLFVNSISALGLRWELSPEVVNGKPVRLITKYNLIKNVPSSHFTKIYYRHYYPKVDYEFRERQ